MKAECSRSRDVIWDCARAGGELPAEVRRHVDECPDCRRAFSEARQLSGPIDCAAQTPISPDCRSAVAARISRQRPSYRPAWAYAFAVLLAVGLVVFGANVFLHRPSEPAQQVAQRPCQPPKPELAQPVKEQPKRIAVLPLVCEKQIRRTYTRTHEPLPRKRVHHPKIAQRPVEPEPTVIVLKSNTSIAPPATLPSRPVAIAIATWPSADDKPNDNYDYSYTDHDSVTGTTTKCSVRRNGESVEIYLESEPSGGKPPVKGSIEYETNPSA